MPSQEELLVVKNYLAKKTEGESVFQILYKQREALTAINRPQRMSMGHQRMANLIYLAFEHEVTKALNLEISDNFCLRRDKVAQSYHPFALPSLSVWLRACLEYNRIWFYQNLQII